MNPFMAPATHRSQITESFSTDAPISFVMHLLHVPSRTFDIYNQRVLKSSGVWLAIVSIFGIVYRISCSCLILKMGFKCLRTPLPLLLKIVAYLLRAFKVNHALNEQTNRLT